MAFGSLSAVAPRQCRLKVAPRPVSQCSHRLTISSWTQGPVLLQALNILENFDLKEMGYNSTRYIHTLYQAMNLAYADRDFYYGDPYVAPEEPVEGLLSKAYAQKRADEIDPEQNNPDIGPGDPYEFQRGSNQMMQITMP